MRFNQNTYRSLNESINEVQNPQVALDEARDYAALLEGVLADLCNEFDLDPDAVMEMAQTAARNKELSARERGYEARGQGEKSDEVVTKLNRERDSRKYLYSKGGKRTLIPKKGTAGRAGYEAKAKRGKILTRDNY